MAHRFQFSLKSLMVLVLVIAAFFAGMAVQRNATEHMRALADQERDRAMIAERKAQEVIQFLATSLDEAKSEMDRSTRVEGANDE
jgi:hypothetical protein